MKEFVLSGLLALALTFLIPESFICWIESAFCSGGDNL